MHFLENWKNNEMRWRAHLVLPLSLSRKNHVRSLPLLLQRQIPLCSPHRVSKRLLHPEFGRPEGLADAIRLARLMACAQENHRTINMFSAQGRHLLLRIRRIPSVLSLPLPVFVS